MRLAFPVLDNTRRPSHVAFKNRKPALRLALGDEPLDLFSAVSLSNGEVESNVCAQLPSTDGQVLG